ncbi:MAG TPA: histidine kinase [Bacteroidales bacterium]|nr:histidine kinase [Bacteroidales bacterium]
MKKEKHTRTLIHILVWIVIMVLPVYSARRFRMGNTFLITYYTFTIISALIFYSNYIILVPWLFFRKKRFRYYIAALALVFCFYFISDFTNEHIVSYLSKGSDQQQFERLPGEELKPPGQPRRSIIRILIPHARIVGYASSSLFMVFLSLGLRVLERQSRIEKIQEEMEKAKLSSELAFLKSQISPHFFFNTLNNIYSLIGRNNEDSKNAVIKLSRLMRYVLNESGQENKFLSNEIEFMNNYIDLMKLRIVSKTRLNVNFPSDYKDITIPHLLFISLIENAFKYGISVQDESFVSIKLECGENNIFFSCENGLPDTGKEHIFTSSGIGLKNLKKRLDLLYPGRHQLSINRTRDKFEASLNIRL